ncbi:MAG: hypothetical protein KC425_00895, partial [Anaerolineales bacterium]|nr:hypothetical protein [Anaerolineales bacterium]
DKYKDIGTGRQVKLDGAARVPHIDAPFTAELGARFDLLLGMHAHGCNAAVIDAAAESGCGFVLFPCCVIDEPLLPLPGIDWLACVAQLALQRGLATTPFRLNFKGQHIGLYHVGEKVGLVAK